jgi:hypothetical protein
MGRLNKLAIFFLGLALLFRCGANAFESTETQDPAEDATLALEKENPEKAISILESALEDEPTNYKYLSILALAYAARAGIIPIDFAENFATTSKSGSDPDNNNQIQLMFSVLPEPETQTLADIDKAVDILVNQIPQDQRQPGDVFKIAIFQTAAFVLHTKAFDSDLDGDISLEEIAAMSDEQADALLSQLLSASTLAGLGADKSSKKAAESLEKFNAKIQDKPGDTDADKLRNYLATQGDANESVPVSE